MDVYIGIDVACAKDKYLPLVMCYWESERLIPLPLASSPIKPPKCKWVYLSRKKYFQEDLLQHLTGF